MFELKSSPKKANARKKGTKKEMKKSKIET